MASYVMAKCIAISGQTDPEKALNLRITVLMRILLDPLPLTRRVLFNLIISRGA